MTAQNMNGLKPSTKETNKMIIGLELDPTQIGRIVYADLVDTRDAFLDDMESDEPAVFSHNEVYDKMQIQKHIDAIELLLEWYREPE